MKTIQGPNYPYKDLNTKRREFRVFELLPGERSSKIHGKLFCYSLHDAPEYEALSYTWGNTESIATIQVDRDLSFRVSTNLERALKDLRLKETSILLWIDAICINQANITEKNYQVPLMHYIYQNAFRVRIWLDYEINPTGAPFAQLALLSRQSTTNNLGDDPDFWEPVSLIGAQAQPYWSRVWIQQELYYAKAATLFCRENMVSLDSLALFHHLVEERMAEEDMFFKWMLVSPYQGISAFGLVDDEYTNRTKNNFFQNILDALAGFRKFSCTDARDKVYACLNLVKDYTEGEITVNYDLSIMETYLNVVTFVLTKHKSLAFLIHAGEKYCLEPGAPTWVPNWNYSECFTLPSRLGRNVDIDCRILPTCTPLILDQKYLKVSGFCFNYILRTFDPFPKEQKDLEDWSILKVWIQILAEVYTLRSEKSGQGIKTKLSRALQSVSGNRRARGWMLEDIEGLLNTLHISIHPDTFKTVHQLALRIKKFLDARARNPQKCDQNERRFLKFMQSEGRTFERTYQEHIITTLGYNIFLTRQFNIGLAPAGVTIGDEIWFLFSCPLPIILRRQGDTYSVQGPAYVSGFMHSEAIDGIPSVVEPGQRFGEFEIKEITLR